MKYLGIAKREKDQSITMPDSFKESSQWDSYEVIEVGGDILLIPPPLDKERLARIEKLTKISIEEHRKTLKGLAK
ncbi:MAG: hypothetical protein DYG83_11690 [Candidatus Brocadia sp. AMX2]|uniref:Class I glutamine amidotransferase n=1 Tax=Candidatus Brocadia sinica JPN1 TaxID=1197129 RepID=A0ABQ0JSD4_9BACT|nr:MULTISPECIES: hypothetical protein [Brocadia]MBC6933160.1 hypothetical protein [Candidatus Brocadia sp.]MBL1168359.1 hypothetical protein [Candidatus Brocadia sp. AMX1]MCK6469684.1 hypothetical protein [Candidatus Brocadia sinica]NOG43231.1 hypothetical protein [Planctomycetota bacterium]GJQ47581.1 MAG: hypothetical protein JETCAE04_33350 [Candidatus Jettenia caeni]